MTVTIAAPGGAVASALKLKLLVEDVLAGLKEAVTPEGSPDADRFTVPENPFTGLTVIVVERTELCCKLKAAGRAVSVNSGEDEVVIVRLTVVLAVKVPDVPVIVTLVVPAFALPLTLSVSELEPVVLRGLNDAVTPVGSPLAARSTAPANPFAGTTEMVELPVVPCGTVMLPGFAEIENDGAADATTVRLAVTLTDRVPEVPTIMMLVAPVAADVVAVSVRVVVLLELLGVNVTLTPAGRPETEKLTLEEKPFVGRTVTVLCALAPCFSVIGEIESAKPGELLEERLPPHPPVGRRRMANMADSTAIFRMRTGDCL